MAEYGHATQFRNEITVLLDCTQDVSAFWTLPFLLLDWETGTLPGGPGASLQEEKQHMPKMAKKEAFKLNQMGLAVLVNQK